MACLFERCRGVHTHTDYCLQLHNAFASASACSSTVQLQSAAKALARQAPLAFSPRQLRPAAAATIRATIATASRTRHTQVALVERMCDLGLSRTPEMMSTVGMLSPWTHVNVCVLCVLAFVRARAGEQSVAFATLPCGNVQLHSNQQIIAIVLASCCVAGRGECGTHSESHSRLVAMRVVSRPRPLMCCGAGSGQRGSGVRCTGKRKRRTRAR